MKVHVRLFGELERFLPEGTDGRTAAVSLPEGATGHDLVVALGVPCEGHYGSVAIAVGDRVVKQSDPLQGGDVVSIFPPLAGGGWEERKMPSRKEQTAPQSSQRSRRNL